MYVCVCMKVFICIHTLNWIYFNIFTAADMGVQLPSCSLCVPQLQTPDAIIFPLRWHRYIQHTKAQKAAVIVKTRLIIFLSEFNENTSCVFLVFFFLSLAATSQNGLNFYLCNFTVSRLLSVFLLVTFQPANCKGQHSISYTLSRNQTVVVEYSHDNDTDMFQVKATLSTPQGYEGCSTQAAFEPDPQFAFLFGIHELVLDL